MHDYDPLSLIKRQILIIQPHLAKAWMRLLLHYEDLQALPTKTLVDFEESIKMYTTFLTEEEETTWRPQVYDPPQTPEEETISLLADLVAALLFREEISEKKTIEVLREALSEVERAYGAVKRKGGGWRKNSTDNARQTAALQFFRANREHLKFLKEEHLLDPSLYNEGGGQEKRNFTVRLLGKIIHDTTHQHLPIKEIMRCLKTEKTPLL